MFVSKMRMARCLVAFGVSFVMALSVGGCAREKSGVAVSPGSPAAGRISKHEKPAAYFHDKCKSVLATFVDEKGTVDYKGLCENRLELRALLDEFGNLAPAEYRSWSRDDKIAFWINTYNLEKLKIVADNYPIKPSSQILTAYWGPFSLRHIEEKIAGYRFDIMGEQFTFARIEKSIFAEEFGDPRAFLALTSAGVSSPPLRNEPCYGYRLNEQLEDQVKRFISSPLAFDIDREKRIISLSAVFELSSHGKDFMAKYATDKKFKEQPPVARAALNFITNYISKQDVSFLETGNYIIKYMKYDWTINDGS